MQTKTHWKKLTNPNYLGAWDVPEGEEIEVKLLEVKKELVTGAGGETSECIVASLENRKPMILNKTNCKTIKAIFGTPYIEDWKGKVIRLYVDPKVRAFGEITEGLRVKAEKVDQRQKLSPTSERWSGAIEALQNGKCDIAYIRKNFRVTEENIKKLQEATNAQ